MELGIHTVAIVAAAVSAAAAIWASEFQWISSGLDPWLETK